MLILNSISYSYIFYRIMEAEELSISSPSEMTKVSVAVRVRPLIEREKKGDAQIHWQIGPQELRAFDPEAKRIVPNSSTYTYDHVFTQSTQTQQVYDKVVSPIVKQAFKGFNGTILCYGQTSSGKTHTLYGSKDDKGIILLFADHLFQKIKADESRRQYIIKVGLIEIYNEKVSDLLKSSNPLELLERDGSIVPHGLEELTVFDIDDWKKVTERVQKERKIGETRMNKESSRSHTILRVTIESFDLTSNGSFDEAQENSLTTAVLHFVDLAGSEKQSQTGAEGERFREQVNIKMSLSVLSRVIQQLSEEASVSSFEGRSSSNGHSLAKANSMPRTAPKPRFINFRDSKLTRLLQSSLNGNAYISMVCNVTIASFEETKSTLLFAQQAKKIQIRPKQNLCSTKTEHENKLKELQELLNRRQSVCPTMIRPTSTKPGHSNPEPMTQFAYYKNKYASSSIPALKNEIENERESCQNLAEVLKTMEKHIQQLMTEKAELEQRLKQQEVVIEKAEEMNLVLQEHDKCQDLAIELKTTEDQLYKIILSKHALEEQLKSQQEAYDEAKSVVLKMSEKLETMEENYKAGLREKDDKIKRMTAILKEHEKCQDLSKELQTTRDQETIIADKVAAEKQLVAQHNDYQINAQSVIEKLKEELTTMQASAVAERHGKEDAIKRMNMICLDQSADLKTARDQVEQLIADKAALDERLKAQHETYEVCQLTIQKLKEERASVERKTVAERLEKEDTIKKMNIIVKQHEHCQDFSTDLEIARAQVVQVSADNADWEIRFEAQRVDYDAELECVKHHAQEVFEEMSEKISELNAVVQEHKKSLNLSINNNKTLSEQVDELRADKIALEGRLNMDRTALASVMESIKRKEAELYDKEQEINQLNKIVEEYESCQEKEANYLLDQTLLESLKADKVKLKEQLKAQQDAYEAAELSIQTMKQELSMKQLEIKERDMNIDKLNRVLEDHDDCDAVYSDLNAATIKIENLLAVKEELEERVKSLENSYEKAQSTALQLKVELDNVQDPGKPGRGVVVTRGTQCDEITSELDQYKDATKHYRNRAHKAEFELQREQIALRQKDQYIQSPEPQCAPNSPPPPPNPQRSGVTTSSKFPMVETGVQCSLLNEIIEQSAKSGLGDLWDSIPELAQLDADFKRNKIALSNSKLALDKCSCILKPKNVIGAGKPTENVVKYNKPSGFQKKMAFFQGGSTRMNTKEGVLQPTNQPRTPTRLQPLLVEEKEETKITHVPAKDLEDIENAPDPIQATPPAEEEPEEDFSWLMQLVKKKT
ncbi:unnamed protein product [Orchesella dallaii]|uniref:Kinesin motor domain-containing protein n=1 Tax=Orchesella dallaii TaxID=48710 RepID=A0ABP1QLJ0_9HEXA